MPTPLNQLYSSTLSNTACHQNVHNSMQTGRRTQKEEPNDDLGSWVQGLEHLEYVYMTDQEEG